jgi:hypothetical protein
MTFKSVLTHVTIYRDRALCARRCTLTPAVSSEARIADLPLAAMPGSIRVRFVAPPTNSIRIIDVRPGFDVQFGEAVAQSTEIQNRDKAKAEVTRIDSVMKRVDVELSEYQKLKPRRFRQKAGDPPRPAPIDASLSLARFVDERIHHTLTQKHALRRQLRDAEEELALRERRLAEASAQQRTQAARISRAALVTLSAPLTERVEIEIEYQLEGVRWTPSYALRLERGFERGTLLMRASVAQDTGEDWTGVSLSLSTAALERSTNTPELLSLRVGRTQAEPPRPGFRPPPPGLETLFEDYDAARSPQHVVAPALASFGGSDALELEPDEPGSDELDQDDADQAERAPSLKISGTLSASVRARSSKEAFSTKGTVLGRSAHAPVSDSTRRAVLEAPMLARASRAPAPTAPMRPRTMGLEESGPSADFAAVTGGGSFAEARLELRGSVAAQSRPGIMLDDELLDYRRLVMQRPEVSGARGRLHLASPWDLAFTLGHTVGIENISTQVISTEVERWRQRARAVAALSLPPLSFPVTAVEHFDFRYDCANPVEVPSTGRWTTVSVTHCEVGLKPQYVCVPSVDAHVYRTLAIRNETPAALLSGPVDVWVGDEFLMTTSLPTIAPGARTEHLGLGVEEAIKVARKTHFIETSGGFLGGSMVLRHEVEVEVRNLLSSAVSVEIRERIPQPQPNEKDIKVEEAEVKPHWEKPQSPVDGSVITGARFWNIVLSGGQRQTVSAQFLIRIPADKMLVGGNRRD